MIAGHRDLPQVFPDGSRIAEVLFCERRKADDRVHRRADIMRHGRKKIGFCLVCHRRFFRCRLELLIKVKHDSQIKYEQDQETCGNKANQQPVCGVHVQVLHRHEAEKCPSSCRCNRRIGEYTFLTAGVEDGNRTG